MLFVFPAFEKFLGWMSPFWILITAVLAISIADVILQGIYELKSIGDAFLSPWMYLVLFLYFYQIVAFTFLFQKGTLLFAVAVTQSIVYVIVTVLCSKLIYKHKVDALQWVGMVIGVVGIIIMYHKDIAKILGITKES
jgi:drug/metabolite transporter (DMT)-like permease